MALLLWRWSTAAQIVSALILAIFVVLSLSVNRRESCGRGSPPGSSTSARWSSRSCIGSFLRNRRRFFSSSALWYMFTKTLFVVLLVCGASAFARVPLIGWSRTVVMAVAAWSVVGALVFNTLDSMGAAQAALVLALLSWSAAALLRRSDTPAAGWLASGFIARALLSAGESAAHTSQVVALPWSSWPNIPLFLASYSSFDAAAEWVIALGCVLMLYRTIHDEVKQAKTDLTAAQAVLERIADRDPVTGLANRRALPAIFRDVSRRAPRYLFL